MFNIAGKIAIVTGGANGIGLGICRELLNHEARGVVIADVNSTSGKTSTKLLADEFGQDRISFIETDVTDKTSFEACFQRTITEYGNIDILVNNAAIVDECNYEKEIAINLTGTTHGIILGLEKYILNNKSESEGVILNISSLLGCHPHVGLPIYGATKSGIISLTQSMGSKPMYKKTNIKVVAICPSCTATNIMTDKSFRKRFAADAVMDDVQNQVTQSVSHVAKSAIEIITKKPSGSIWICAYNKDIYEYVPPLADAKYLYE